MNGIQFAIVFIFKIRMFCASVKSCVKEIGPRPVAQRTGAASAAQVNVERIDVGPGGRTNADK
jgi:hypothetical protein